MLEFGTVNKVNIREIWKNEEYDFTPWLAENLDKLSKVLGFELELVDIEAPVEACFLDILAKDTSSNKYVIIENQYGNTDHKHLGQLMTYAAGYNAEAVIWISEDIKEEHRKVLDWLNEMTTEEVNFYGIQIEVFRIDESKPAYNFKLVSFPNEWSKSSLSSSKDTNSTKMEAYSIFFQDLIDTLRTKYKFTNAKKGLPQSWYNYSTGIRGIAFSSNFSLGGKSRAELYIDKGDMQVNKVIFDMLFEKKSLFESLYGEELTWERLDEKRASRIAVYRNGSIEDDSATLEEIKNWMIQKLLKFKEVIKDKVILEILQETN